MSIALRSHKVNHSSERRRRQKEDDRLYKIDRKVFSVLDWLAALFAYIFIFPLVLAGAIVFMFADMTRHYSKTLLR